MNSAWRAGVKQLRARSIESRPMPTQPDVDSLARAVLLGAFALSAVFGAIVHRTNFCTMGAIADMVTQSAGPYYAAAMGMALAAYEAKDRIDFDDYMEKAAYTLSHARPTTVARMESITTDCLRAAKQAKAEGRPADLARPVAGRH